MFHYYLLIEITWAKDQVSFFFLFHKFLVTRRGSLSTLHQQKYGYNVSKLPISPNSTIKQDHSSNTSQGSVVFKHKILKIKIVCAIYKEEYGPLGPQWHFSTIDMECLIIATAIAIHTGHKGRLKGTVTTSECYH